MTVPPFIPPSLRPPWDDEDKIEVKPSDFEDPSIFLVAGLICGFVSWFFWSWSDNKILEGMIYPAYLMAIVSIISFIIFFILTRKEK